MSTQDFFNKYNGKGIDYDGAYGFQCVDLYDQYCKEVVGAPIILVSGAVNIWDSYPTDFFEKIPNTPDGVPQLGDVVIWSTGVGPNGHVAVFKEGDTNQFTSFDENWPVNSLCHFQQHNYNSVLGWLRPKPSQIDPLTECLRQHDDLVNKCNEKDQQIADLQKQLTDCQNKPAQVITITKEVPSTTTVQVPVNQQNTASTATVTPDPTNTVVTGTNQPNLDGSNNIVHAPVSFTDRIYSFLSWLLGK